MKKKLLATAVTAATATLSAGAFAAVTVTNTDANYPRVAPGGTVVFENQVITQSTAPGTEPDLTVGDKIVMSLPTGMNFSGTPTATASGTVKLESNSLGDPGDAGLVSLTDTNGDGGNDRMQVTVKVGAASGDTVTISGSATYSGTATKDPLKATIFVEDKDVGVNVLDTDNVLATRVASLTTPLAQTETNANLTIPTTVADPVTTPVASTLVLTVPAGKSTGQTAILTLGAGLEFDDATAAIGITALTDGAPGLTVSGETDGDNKLTFTLGAATTKEVQYLITINGFEVVTGAKVGAVAGTLSGTAGLSGSATVAVLAQSATTAALVKDAKTASIVAGADASQTLPSFTVTEVFGGDLGAAGETITLVPSSGLRFDTGVTPTVTPAGGVTGSVVVNSASKATLTIGSNDDGAAGSLTIVGLKATATSTASGNQTIQVGDASVTGETKFIPGTVLTVASAIPKGDVTVTGPETIDKIGKGAKGEVGTITLTEATYGAITDRNETSTQSAFIQVAPPAGYTITAVAPTITGDVTFGTPVAATPADGSWVIPVGTESSTKSVVDLDVTYNVPSSAAVGSEVVFTLAGNAGVSGTAKVATIASTTTLKVGVIPSVDPGDVDAQVLAPFTISENFTDSTAAGEFRLIAPQGVTFTGTVTGTTTKVVATTFNANDTLILGWNGDSSQTFTPSAVIGPNVAVDTLLSFTVADGDGGLDADAGSNATGLVGDTVNLAYTGDVVDLEAGAAAALNIGFGMTRSITGGLGPFTVTSSDEAVAEVSVDDRTITLTGVGAGTTTITVTDALGSSDTFLVTVAEGAAQTSYDTATIVSRSGAATDATFSAGVSADGGTTFDDEFTTGDEVDIVGTVMPDPDDIGEAGSLFVVVRTQTNIGTEDATSVWRYMDLDGNFQVWNTVVADLQPAQEVDALEASHILQIFSGELAEGTHKVFLGYMTDADGDLIYTSVPLTVTVTAP